MNNTNSHTNTTSSAGEDAKSDTPIQEPTDPEPTKEQEQQNQEQEQQNQEQEQQNQEQEPETNENTETQEQTVNEVTESEPLKATVDVAAVTETPTQKLFEINKIQDFIEQENPLAIIALLVLVCIAFAYGFTRKNRI